MDHPLSVIRDYFFNEFCNSVSHLHGFFSNCTIRRHHKVMKTNLLDRIIDGSKLQCYAVVQRTLSLPPRTGTVHLCLVPDMALAVRCAAALNAHKYRV